MSDEQLNLPSQVLEDLFFAQGEEQLHRELRSAIDAGKRKQRIRDTAGISDHQLIDRLCALNLGDDTIAALSLVPLVMVAWADGKMHEDEREALLSAAERFGLKPGTISHRLYKGWLQSAPQAELVEAWKQYMQALTKKLAADHKRLARDEFVGRAEQIAAAAGGIRGIASMSEAEQRVIEDLATVFD